ncbi:MAG: iron ABC transporter permease [Burkholderiaceae bacterium]
MTSGRSAIAIGRPSGLSRRRAMILALLAVAVLVSGVAAASAGAVRIPIGDVLAAALAPLGGHADVPADYLAVLYAIRFPRVVLAAIVGGALALAGAGMQGLFRNPLADPALIGASSGAALAVAFTIVLGNALMPGFTHALGAYALPVAAFCGCLAATFAVKRLASSAQIVSIGAMLLAGVAVNLACEAGINAMTFAANDEQLRNLTFWRMGSLAGASWPLCAMAAACAALGGIVMWRCAAGLNALAMGEEPASHAGFDVRSLSRRTVIAGALLVAAAVASAGMVWFVGLVAPHVVRLMGGADQRYVMPASLLLGSALVLIADLIARLVVIPAELPIGVPLALFGTPLFIWLLSRARLAGRL